MGRMGSTTSARARQMRRELARWQRIGLKLREHRQQRGIPMSTLTWWRQVYRRAGNEEGKGVATDCRRSRPRSRAGGIAPASSGAKTAGAHPVMRKPLETGNLLSLIEPILNAA